MLWDIIRDFIVQNITGGVTSDGYSYGGIVGNLYDVVNGQVDDNYIDTANSIYYKIGTNGSFTGDIYVSLSDWLATTITIISMCLIVIFAIWLVRWVFKAVTSAFLLRR